MMRPKTGSFGLFVGNPGATSMHCWLPGFWWTVLPRKVTLRIPLSQDFPYPWSNSTCVKSHLYYPKTFIEPCFYHKEFSFVYMSVYTNTACVCICACWYRCMCVEARGQQEVSSSITPYLIFGGRVSHWAQSSTILQDWMTREPQRVSCL